MSYLSCHIIYVHFLVEWNQISHNNSLHSTTIIMKDTSSAQVNLVLSLLDSGHSGYQIFFHTGLSTGTISKIHSRHHPNLSKSTGGHPFKLSENNISCITRLITSGKADNTVQIAKSLAKAISQSLSPQTI